MTNKMTHTHTHVKPCIRSDQYQLTGTVTDHIETNQYYGQVVFVIITLLIIVLPVTLSAQI